jgi:CheY-specific phosphatase CheX
VSVAVRGARCLTLGLAADADLARRLGHGIAGGDSAEDDPSLTVDALGEFLNVVAGGAVARLEADGVGAGIEPVRLGELPASGHVFDLVATTGRGALFVHSAAG